MKVFGAALLGAWFVAPAHSADIDSVIARMNADASAGAPLVAHVVVALCDNRSQGIVPVPEKLGDGDAPASNLYWGAMYGVKSFLRRSADWRTLPVAAAGDRRVLDRALFTRKVVRNGNSVEVYLLAEAWRGKHIAAAIERFLQLSQGRPSESLKVGERTVEFGGASHVIAFVGHNGLMDFAAPELPSSPAREAARSTMVLACLSHRYFEPLLKSHSVPLLMTTGLMAPEAYALDAAVTRWFEGAAPQGVRSAAANAYARYQRISETSARRLFVTP